MFHGKFLIYWSRASTWEGSEYRDDHLLAKGQHMARF